MTYVLFLVADSLLIIVQEFKHQEDLVQTLLKHLIFK